jgi:hypothetical protein
VLFRKAFLSQAKERLSVDDLARTIDTTKDYITALFHPDTGYEEVDRAVKLVMETQTTLERELDVLLKCEALSLTKEGKDRFRLIH